MAKKKNKKERFGSAFDRVLSSNTRPEITQTDAQTSRRPDVQIEEISEIVKAQSKKKSTPKVKGKSKRYKISLKDKGYEKITLYLDPEVKKKLQMKGVEFNTEMSEVANTILEKYIDKFK